MKLRDQEALLKKTTVELETLQRNISQLEGKNEETEREVDIIKKEIAELRESQRTRPCTSCQNPVNANTLENLRSEVEKKVNLCTALIRYLTLV